jgi:hypothetical protein
LRINSAIVIFLTILVFVISGCDSDGASPPLLTQSENRPVVKLGFSASEGILLPVTAPNPVPGPGKRLWVIYMVGSDLESDGGFATSDLTGFVTGYNQLSSVQRDALSVLIAFGGSDKDGWRGMKFVNIDQLIADSADGVYGNEVAAGAYLYQADEAHMGDVSSLRLFLNYVADGFPDHDLRFVSFWDHGASWGGFGNDENYNSDPLQLSEIDDAFASSRFGRADLIGFDACLMASLEVADRVEPHGDLLLASEELEPGHGWAYNLMVPSFMSSTNMVTFATTTIDDYVVGSNHAMEADGKTLSLLDLSRVAAVEAALDTSADDLRGAISVDTAVCREFVLATFFSPRFGAQGDDFVSIDLREFADRLRVALPPGPLVGKLDTLVGELDAFVIHSAQDGSRPGSRGLGIVPANYIGNSVSEDPKQQHATQGWRLLNDASQQKSSADTTSPQLSSLQVTTAGITTFFADPTLTSVETVYGFETIGEFGQVLIPIARIPAEMTGQAGERFTPTWDRRWFTLSFAAGQVAQAIPLRLEHKGVQHMGQTVDVYEGEFDFVRAGKDYSTEPFPFEMAKLEIAVNSSFGVVEHDISTYSLIYSSPDDPTPQKVIDKEDIQFQVGDQFRFVVDGLQVGSGFYVPRQQLGPFLTLEQPAQFHFEVVSGVDPQGQPLLLKFGVLAQDFARNRTLTDLQAPK